METKKTILTGTMIATAILGAASIKANTSNLFDYTALGSGSEVRSVLLNNVPSAVKMLDLACGEKKEAKATDANATGAKATDANATGAKVTDAKATDPKATSKDGDKKAKDAKCGDGKCGDKKTKAAEPK